MALKLYFSHFKLDFYGVKSKVGLPCKYVRISYEILVQVVPLVASYGIIAISQSFLIRFLCCEKKSWSI